MLGRTLCEALGSIVTNTFQRKAEEFGVRSGDRFC